MTLLTLISGGRVVLHPRFDAEATLAEVSAQPVDRLAVVPTMLRMLLPSLGERERAALSALGSPRLLISGGEVLPPGLGRAVRSALPHAGVADVFGMTETSTSDFIVRPETTTVTLDGSVCHHLVSTPWWWTRQGTRWPPAASASCACVPGT